MTRSLMLIILPIFFISHSHGSLHFIKSEAEYTSARIKHFPALFIFKAEWCPICTTIDRALTKISMLPEFQNIFFAIVDVEEIPFVREYEDIPGVPAFLFIKNQREVKREVGISKINTFIPSLKKKIAHLLLVDETHSLQAIETQVLAAYSRPSFFNYVTFFMSQPFEIDSDLRWIHL